jgi:hypothetical protein
LTEEPGRQGIFVALLSRPFMHLTYCGTAGAADIGLAIGSWSRARTCTPLRHLINRQARLPIPPSRTKIFSGLSNIQNYLRCDRNLQQFSLITAARLFIVTMGATEESKKGRL